MPMDPSVVRQADTVRGSSSGSVNKRSAFAQSLDKNKKPTKRLSSAGSGTQSNAVAERVLPFSGSAVNAGAATPEGKGILQSALRRGTSGSGGAGGGNTTASFAPIPSGAKHAVVAATMANVELASAKASSELYYGKYMATDGENVRLRADLEQQEVDALEVIRRLEGQLVAAFEEASVFKQGVEERLARQSDAEKEVVAHYEELLKERDRSIADFASLVERLQDDLRQASRYVQQRQEHNQELLELHNTIEELVAAHERETAALRFQSIDRKMKLVALEKTMREEFQSMVDQESRRLLEAKHTALLQHNTALEKDKEGLVRDIDDLISLTTKINAERTNMKRVSELHKTAHEEVLRHTVARNRQGREVELKVQRLEARVRELMAELQHTKADVKAAYTEKVNQLTEQLTAAQNANVVMQKELKTMRALAGKVVEQRSDLEKFFYTALEDCKRYKSASASLAATTVAGTLASTAVAARGTAGMASVLTPRLPHAPSPRPTTIPNSGTASRTDTPLPTRRTGSTASTSPADTFRLTAPALLESTTSDVATTHALPPVKAAAVLKHQHPTVVSSAPLTPPPSNNGAYLEDLSWEDKEKVIKALFFYINSTYYKVPSATAAA